MSIQPTRVLSRIVEQVDASDWPTLEAEVSDAERVRIQVFRSPRHARYASPAHFWMHALREELSARGRRVDLVYAGQRALCEAQAEADWRRELGALCPLSRDVRTRSVYRMLDSECRRSSVVETQEGWLAHFWGHGDAPTWHWREACIKA